MEVLPDPFPDFLEQDYVGKSVIGWERVTKSSAMYCAFELSNVIEMYNRIAFSFYVELPLIQI